jgi:hypothetical protein
MGFVRRRTRRRTMLVAGGMAYAAGRGARGEQDQAEPQPDEVPAAPPPPAPTSGDTDVEELQKLAQLHDAGALTDDEFAAEKAKILA